MLKRNEIHQLNDFFLEMNKRPDRCVYFYRIFGYNNEINEFILKYYNTAKAEGVIIEGKIPNPNEQNLSYYAEIMGTDFNMSVGFIGDSLKKWLPRITQSQREIIAIAIYDSLDGMRRAGKNENMLKNAYIKFMCWLYYKFERIVNRLGENSVPKILYEGDITKYELMMLSILSCAGCDVIILQYNGDEKYLLVDAESEFSDRLIIGEMESFPKEYSLKYVGTCIRRKLDNETLYGEAPDFQNCTNAWISGKFFENLLISPVNRGTDKMFFYNCFCRINGVEDKLTFQSELIKIHTELEKSGRGLVIAEKNIPMPTPEEISAVKRDNYQNREQLLKDLSGKIGTFGDIILKSLVRKAFLDVLLEMPDIKEMPLSKLVSKAVHLICWFRRFQSGLFKNWKMPDISCFIMFGGCQSSNEALFLKFLSRLPVDVIILNPDISIRCLLEDKLLYEINYPETLAISEFPDKNAAIRIGTAAYHAERDLDKLMYQDSGMYRNMQHSVASSVVLDTMYEEICVLWNQELKYRPNFNTDGNEVIMPVIFAKVSGIKDGLVSKYWPMIKELITPETFVIKSVPLINQDMSNPMKAHVTEFFRNGKLQREKIRSHKCYSYGYLRESIQNHIFDKLQLLIDRKTIKGTFENGTEYTIVSVVLNMSTEIVRMIQKFDFTKKNPKIIYINTTENIISLEDSILMAFLNLIGFDIVFFVPTGYKSIENYYNHDILNEHQAGNYVYDLTVPDFNSVSSNTRPSWREKIFKRGT